MQKMDDKEREEAEDRFENKDKDKLVHEAMKPLDFSLLMRHDLFKKDREHYFMERPLVT